MIKMYGLIGLAAALILSATPALAENIYYKTEWEIAETLKIDTTGGEYIEEISAFKAERGWTIAKSRLLPSGAAVLIGNANDQHGRSFIAAGEEMVQLETEGPPTFCQATGDKNKFRCLVDKNRDGSFDGRFTLLNPTRLPIFDRRYERPTEPIVGGAYEIILPSEMETLFFLELKYSDYSRKLGQADFELNFVGPNDRVPIGPPISAKISEFPVAMEIMGADFVVWKPNPKDKKKLFFRSLSSFAAGNLGLR